MRPSWDEYFLLIAKLVSTRSTCNSRPTGAVLVKDKQILATGYNGSMPGAPHCIDETMDDGTPYCHRRALKIADVDKYNYCRASHAEANAIAQAARYGVAIKGAALYVTLQPCFVCLKLLATAQIKRVYFELAYESMDEARDAFWDKAVKEAGIEVFQQLEHLGGCPGFHPAQPDRDHFPAPAGRHRALTTSHDGWGPWSRIKISWCSWGLGGKSFNHQGHQATQKAPRKTYGQKQRPEEKQSPEAQARRGGAAAPDVAHLAAPPGPGDDRPAAVGPGGVSASWPWGAMPSATRRGFWRP